MWKYRSLALALLITILPAWASAQGAFPGSTPKAQAVKLAAIPASARIVFHTNQVIYTMDAAGGNITQITFNQGRVLDHVAVSPDRKRVVASYFLNGIDKLVLFDLDAGTEVLLLPYFYSAGVGGVDWDRQGNIYFAGIEDLPYPNATLPAELIANAAANEVYRVKYDGTNIQRLTNTSDRGEADVSVSADGTMLAYMATHLDIVNHDPSELWVNTVTGSAPRRVYVEDTPITRSVHDPELSPDNTELVFSRVNPAFHNFPAGINSAQDLYRVKLNGSSLTLITTPGPVSVIPDWVGSSIVYLELSDEAVDYLGVTTINANGTSKVRINADANIPKWIETDTVPAVPPPAPAPPPPANLIVPAVSWSIYPNPADDGAILTAAAYLGNTTGEATAMAKMIAMGGDHAPRYLKWRDVETNLGVYDFTKLDALVATSGELPLVVNLAPIWDDGNLSIPTGLAFTTFADPAVVLAYQNMLTAAAPHLKGRLHVLIVGSEIDTYLTTDSRRAQYAVFLTQVRAWARTIWGTNPFKVTATVRSSVVANWARDWTGLDDATDVNSFTYYPTIPADLANFAPTILSDLSAMTALGPAMFQELGLSSTIAGSSTDLQTAAAEILTGLIALIADLRGHDIPVITWSQLNDISAAVLADFGYSSGQLTAGLGLRTTAGVGKSAYITYCGYMGGSNCADVPIVVPTCTFTLAAASDTFTAALGSDTVALTASDAGCAWTRQILDGAPSWLTVTPASGTGSATITYSVTANTDAASRSARFTVGDGDIFTVTQAGSTPPDVDPEPDPVIPCNSTTLSPTGRQPVTHWTGCRQDTWNRMYADYLINPANPPTMGGKYFRLWKANADQCTGISTGCPYWAIGGWDVLVGQATGDATYFVRGYNKLMLRLGTQESCYLVNGCFTGLGNPATQTDQNMPRVESVTWVWILDWAWNALTPTQRTAAFNKIAAQLEFSTSISANRRLDDSDQTTGIYFGITAFHLLFPNEPRATALYTDALQGGLVPTIPAGAFRPDVTSATRRDAIRRYIQVLAEGGEWFESGGEYNPGTVYLLMDGVDAVNTATGIDYFPEFTTWLPTWADRIAASFTPNLQDLIQWGDEQEPHNLVNRQFVWMINMGMTQGLLHGTAAARRVQGQINDLITKYGAFGSYNTMEPKGQAQASSMFTMFNPYETADDWKIHKAYTGRGAGLLTYRSGWTANDSMFMGFFGRLPKLTSGTKIGQISLVDHAVFGHHGDVMLWKNGESILDHPMGYTGYGFLGGEDANGPQIHGYGGSLEYRSDNFATASDDSHAYAVGTTGGSEFDLPYYQIPRISTHEWTREQLFVPGTTDTLLIYDRANVTDLLDRSQYLTANAGIYQNLTLSDSAPSAKIFVLHTPVSPTIVGNEISWFTPHAQAVKWTALLPATNTKQINNESTRTTCIVLSGCFVWNTSYITDPAQRKFHVKLWPTTPQRWDTFLNVIQVGTAGVVTLKSANGAEGAHVTRPGQADLLAVFNGTQGANLALTAYDPSHKAALDVVRFRGVGYGPIAWTAVGSSTLAYLYDLDPTASWTLNIDGAGANAIVPTSVGEYKFTVSGAGAHTITTVGSGAAPPPDPVGCPTITLSPTTLPAGTTGTLYSQIITASGGTGPYTFAYLPGSAPIASTTLDSDGNPLAGTPTIAGDYSFTIQATAANACVGAQAYTVSIAGAVTSGTLARTGTAQSIGDFTGSASQISGTVTMGAGANGLAIVELEGGASDTATGCTFNGVGMTEITKTASDVWLRAYRLVAPAAGAHTLTCAFSGVPGTLMVATFHGYIGVDQTTPIDAFTTFSSGNYTTGSGTATAVQGTLTTTKTNTWTVMATRSWGAPAAGLASTVVTNCCGLGVFDSGPWALPGSKTMEATFPSATFWNGLMLAINPAP